MYMHNMSRPFFLIFFTPCPSWTSSRIHLLYIVTGWDGAVDSGWCIAALHSLLSITSFTSCQLAILVRSLLIRSTHHRDVPLGFLFFPLGLHLRSCFCGRWSGILCRCPNHWSLFNLSSPVSSNMSALHHLSHRVTPTMSWRHLIWNVFSLLMSCWVTTGQASAL